MWDVASVVLELQAGQPLILQRVRRAVTAESAARSLSTALGSPVQVVNSPWEPGEAGCRVMDARRAGEASFDDWDVRRATMTTPDRPLVVLLDVVTSTWLLVAAPHVASWAGGVRLPTPPSVRPALSDDEIKVGERLLREALAESPGLAAELVGRTFAVDLASGRIFVPRLTTSALELARDAMDEGVVWMTRLRGANLAP